MFVILFPHTLNCLSTAPPVMMGEGQGVTTWWAVLLSLPKCVLHISTPRCLLPY